MTQNKSLINTLSVCIVGEPNTGKSTLINSLLKKKISITSHKAQTTIKNKLGSLIYKNNQLIFYDTPGIFNKNYKLNRAIFMQASSAIASADIVLLIISVKDVQNKNMQDIINYIIFHNKEFIVALNKVDLISKQNLLKKIVYLSKNLKNKDIVPISALKQKGLETLSSFLVKNFSFKKEKKLNNLLYSDNKEYVTEIIREKILDCIHDEIPYHLNIKVDSLKQKQNNVVIHSTIYLNKASHKPIILGKKGQTIKKIGIEARNELEKIFKKKYHLYIFLKPIKSLKGKS